MNPVALITGASRGLDGGIAPELAGLGYDLVINYARQEIAANKPPPSVPGGRAAGQGREMRAEPCQADIALAPDRQRLIAFTKTTFGRLDLLVNNAGVAPDARADILEAGEESFDRLISINVKGPCIS